MTETPSNYHNEISDDDVEINDNKEDLSADAKLSVWYILESLYKSNKINDFSIEDYETDKVEILPNGAYKVNCYLVLKKK